MAFKWWANQASWDDESLWDIMPITPLVIFGLVLVYCAFNAVHKLYFHPLARFPGPWKASLSKSWLLRVSLAGHAEEEFEKLHKKYNARAIRIAPNELHIDDCSLYKTIYNQSAAFTKDSEFYGGFNTPHSVFAECDPALHKQRRRVLNPFFSRTAIMNTQEMLKGKVLELGARIDNQKGPYNIYNAVRCTTVDIISHYTTGRPLGMLKTSDDNFYGGFLTAFDVAAQGLWVFAYRPNLRRIINMIPEPVAVTMNKAIKPIFALRDTCFVSITSYRVSPPKASLPIIFSGLTHLDDRDMVDETMDLLIAGSDTTAYCLTTVIMQVARNPAIAEKLFAALEPRITDPEHLPDLPDLENIPYLNACVREAVRFGCPVSGRLPRVVPAAGTALVVDGVPVPPGTVVGMSAYTMHRNRELWGDDAEEFNPDRWLGEGGKGLDAHMVSFSKGIRVCIGQNLAYAELHILLAYVFRKYEVRYVDREGSEERRDAFTYFLPAGGMWADLERRKV